jgi:hypothetical protein
MHVRVVSIATRELTVHVRLVSVRTGGTQHAC